MDKPKMILVDYGHTWKRQVLRWDDVLTVESCQEARMLLERAGADESEWKIL